MKTHDNILYVTTQGAYLARDGETIAVRVEKDTRLQVPIHTLGGVICFGVVSASPFALGLCAENGVAVSFLSRSGRFMARMEGPQSGNVLVRRTQYRLSDDPAAACDIARAFVGAKIANGRASVLRSAREHADPDARAALTAAANDMADLIAKLPTTTDTDTVRGLEGQAAEVYFRVLNHMIVADTDAFTFHGRSRRPPTDNVNALLSFLYTLLCHDCRSACQSVGLDPQVGFLHRDRPGRPSLALDLMEELRPVLADRLALTLINRRQVAAGGFQTGETGGVQMDDKTRKTVIVAWQERKADELRHPFLDEPITLGLLPHIQARLLSRYIRGDLDAYPPFFWK